MCELQKIFFLRNMMNNQCANIFCTHTIIYGSHSVKFAFIEREYFFNVYPQLSFYVWFVSFYLSPPPKFSPIFPKTCFVFLIFYRGRNLFLTFVVHRGSCCSS